MRLLLLAFLFLCLCLSACGDGDAPAADHLQAGPVTDDTSDQDVYRVSYDDPQALSAALLENYCSAFDELAVLVAGNPPAVELKPLVAELRTRYIGIFVELGVSYDAMDASARAAVDSRVSAGFASVDMDDFNAVSRATTSYRAEDAELADMISDFNIITQYAFYDLLRQQDPEEAARLGI